MLIPVGLDKTEVRRNPWISYAIIAINVAVFLALWVAMQRSDAPQRASEKLRDTLGYLSRHPYLQTPASIERLFSADGKRELEQARQEAIKRGIPAEWEVRRQQQKLNDMASEVFATARESPIHRQGFVPADPDPVKLLTSMFVHAGWFHLIGNMLFFFATGPFLEDVYGRLLFSVLYLLSGVAAVATHVWQNPGSQTSLVGASGAIAGVMGAFLVRMYRSRIRFLWLPIPLFFWWRVRVLIPAFLFLPLWFAEQFWLATSTSETGGVALWAHVGGFLFGVLFAILVWATGVEKRFIHPAIESQIGWSQNEVLVAAMEAGSRGNLEEARRATDRVLREDPTNLDARRYAYEVALDARDDEQIVLQATRLLELYVQHGDTDLAHDLINEVQRLSLAQLPARFCLRAGEFFARQGDAARAIDMYERAARDHPQDAASLRALFHAADLHLKVGRFAQSKEVLDRARTHPAFSNEWVPVWEQKHAEIQKASTAGYRGTRPPERV